MGRRHNHTGRNKQERFVRITHRMMRTPAWRSLDAVGRAAYVELASRYAGPSSNNGRLPFSYRETALALNVSKSTAHRAIKNLVERGFIVEVKRGGFNLKKRHATEWRLTEYGCDVSNAPPTMEFVRWNTEHRSP